MNHPSLAIGDVSITVHDDVGAVRAEWDELARRCDAHVYADPLFVSTWARHVAPGRGLAPRVFVGRRAGRPAMVLPLALERRHGVPMLVPLSDGHSNFNGGLFAPEWNVPAAALHDALLALEPEAEALHLTCVPLAANGHPLVATPLEGAHDAFGGSFDGGFDGYLARNSGKRKRKRHRAATRRFEAEGGWSARRVIDPTEASRTLAEARALLAARFGAEGIADPFADRRVAAFFETLVAQGCGAERPVLALWVLEIGGEIVAVQGGGGRGERFSLLFMTYRSGPLDAAAPGTFLLHEVLRDAAAMGYRRFDLGRGRERYKLSWCEERIPLSEVRRARTTRGRLLLAAQGGAAALKRRVRENERLWSIAQSVRRGISRAA